MEFLDGKALSDQIVNELREQTDDYAREGYRQPHLAAILVGNDPASHTYIENKIRACKLAGFQSTFLHYNEDMAEAELLKKLNVLNRDEGIDGIIVQLPLPHQISPETVIKNIRMDKDVDGFHPENMGRMVQGLDTLQPATPAGIVELLRRYEITTEGRHCVVVGRSSTVGRPISILLNQNSQPGNCTVTACHSYTQDLQTFTRSADILIVAAGKKGMIAGDDVKPGATIIDVGMHRERDESKRSGYRLVGDVRHREMKEKQGYITPVPGGVGPMTVAMLLKNTMKTYLAHIKEEASEDDEA